VIRHYITLFTVLLLTPSVAFAGLSAQEAKADVIESLLQVYKARRGDVRRSDVQVQVRADGTIKAAGSITIGWNEPRNVDEAARSLANQNRCTFANANCNEGFQHVIYFDLMLSPIDGSKWSGEYSYDRTLDEQRAADKRTVLDEQRAANALAQRDRDQAAKAAAAREAVNQKNQINGLLRRQKQERSTLYKQQADEIVDEMNDLSDRFRELKSQRYFSQQGRDLQDAIAAKSAEGGPLNVAESGDPSMLRKVDPTRAGQWDALLARQKWERDELGI
jgi:hypothetical protein